MRYIRIPAILVWAAISALAWHLGSILITQAPSTYGFVTDSAPEIWPLAAMMSLLSLLVAVPIALFGEFVLKPFLRRPFLWTLTTLVGLSLGYFLGVLVNEFVFYRMLEHREMTMWPSPYNTLLVTGLVLALVQIPSLSSQLLRSKRHMVLWVLGVPVAFVAGWLIAEAFVSGATMSSLYNGSGLLMGAVSGALIYGLLMVLDEQPKHIQVGVME